MLRALHARGLALLAVVAGGCMLPDYDKVDATPSGAGTSAPEASAAGGCCAGTKCADAALRECVCATDSFCCEFEWDAACAVSIEELGCGVCEGDLPDPDSEEPIEQSCEDDSGCDQDAPRCSGGVCVQCSEDAHCLDTFPDLPLCIEGACGECRADADCQALYQDEALHCASGLCVGCASDSDCPDGDTCFDGYCQ